MKIHPIIATAFVVGWFALQGWTLSEIFTLSKQFAEFRGEVSAKLGIQTASNETHHE